MAIGAGRQFEVAGSAYDRFMGRYSSQLATAFSDFADVAAGQRVLDVGCGPGALTAELVARVGVSNVCAIDPSSSFVAAFQERFPEVEVHAASGEDIPHPDASFDRVVSQLVMHFVADGGQVAREFARVLQPGGIAAACVWDFAEGMQMLRLFWDAALAVRPDAPDEARTLKFGRPAEIATLFTDAGFVDVEEAELHVASSYADFDELWDTFLGGVGPAGTFLLGLSTQEQATVRRELYERLNEPTRPFTLHAVARAARGRRSDAVR